jgi:hypothetical protein
LRFWQYQMAYSVNAFNFLLPKIESFRTANQVREAPIRILLSEMVCPRPLQPHSTRVRERQSTLVNCLTCFIPESKQD